MSFLCSRHDGWVSAVKEQAGSRIGVVVDNWLKMMPNKNNAVDIRSEVSRLETPYMVGFRLGMTSSTVIGRKLERLYDLPSDTPLEIGELLKVLDRRTVRTA